MLKHQSNKMRKSKKYYKIKFGGIKNVKNVIK